MDVKQHLDDLKKNSDEQWKRYRQLLPKTDDVSLVVVKGHLIIEEILYAIVKEHCANPDALLKAKLSFAQLLHLAQALVQIPDGGWWKSLHLLNGIRNSLVHNLEPKEVDSRLQALNRMCEVPHEHKLGGDVIPTEPTKIAERCICFIIGQLSAIGIVSAFMQRYYGSVIK